MIETRRSGDAPLIALCILLFCAAGRSAFSEDQKPTTAPAATAQPKCNPSTFRVVLDVGHTVDVPGAMSARGIPEYAFNLQLSQDIDKALLDAGFDNTVLLITATAPWRGLVERAA